MTISYRVSRLPSKREREREANEKRDQRLKPRRLQAYLFVAITLNSLEVWEHGGAVRMLLETVMGIEVHVTAATMEVEMRKNKYINKIKN